MLHSVLLITADRDCGLSLQSELLSHGFQVSLADSGTSALQVVLVAKPQLVLCDRRLPVFDGLELARAFKSQPLLRHIPFLVLGLTVQDVENLDRLGIPFHFDDVVPAPHTTQDILHMLDKWLAAEEQPLGIRRPRQHVRVSPQPQHAQPWHRGSFNVVSFCRVLFQLAHRRVDGVIHLTENRKKMTIDVSHGRLVDVHSNYIRESSFGDFLESEGRISARENELSRRHAEDWDLPQGQTLVRMKLLTHREVEHLIRAHKTHKLMELFKNQWKEGLYRFEPCESGSLSGPLDMPLRDYLRTGILHTVSADAIWRLIEFNGKAEMTLCVGRRFDEVAQTFHFSAAEKALAASLSGHAWSELRSDESSLRFAFLLTITHGYDCVAPVGAKATIIPVSEEAERTRREAADKGMSALAVVRKLIRSEKFAEALERSHEAMCVAGETPDLLSCHAWCLYRMSGYENAIVAAQCKEHLKRVISLDPGSFEAYYYLGMIFRDEGKLNLASMQLERACRLNPSHDEVGKEAKRLRGRLRKERQVT